MAKIEFSFLEKYETLKNIITSWEEIFEAGQKSGKKLSIEEAKQEAYAGHDQVFSILKFMSKRELVAIAREFQFDLRKKERINRSLRAQAALTVNQRELIKMRLMNIRVKASERGAKAAEIRHGKPGGNRSKSEEIRSIWASGKYSNRDLCAEQECAALKMSFSAARRALRNTPKPPSRQSI